MGDIKQIMCGLCGRAHGALEDCRDYALMPDLREPVRKSPPTISTEFYRYVIRRMLPPGYEKFLGLYIEPEGPVHRIIWRAERPEGPFQFLTDQGSQDVHYIHDPVAWAPLPRVD